MNASLEVGRSRDPKGLYKQARAGEIRDFTRIESPYKPPERSELALDANSQHPEAPAAQVIEMLTQSVKLS